LYFFIDNYSNYLLSYFKGGWRKNRHKHKRGRLPLSLSAHLKELRKKHQALADQVKKLERGPAPCQLQISKLKKQKLRLKQEIESHLDSSTTAAE